MATIHRALLDRRQTKASISFEQAKVESIVVVVLSYVVATRTGADITIAPTIRASIKVWPIFLSFSLKN